MNIIDRSVFLYFSSNFSWIINNLFNLIIDNLYLIFSTSTPTGIEERNFSGQIIAFSLDRFSNIKSSSLANHSGNPNSVGYLEWS